MRDLIHLIESRQELADELNRWVDFYSKDDAHSGKANNQEQRIIDLARPFPCEYTGMLFRGQTVSDSVIPRLLKGETVVVPKSKRLISSWSKDEGAAYFFAEDAALSNDSALLIKMPSSHLHLIADVSEWIDHTGEEEVIAHAQDLSLTIRDVVAAWLYDEEYGDSVQVWPN